MQDLPDVVADQPATPGNGEVRGGGDGQAGAGGAGKGDVVIAESLDGLNTATLFKVVEQYSGEFIPQTEATPLAEAAVAGLVGGVALG